MKGYKQLTEMQRYQIEALKKAEMLQKDIAMIIGVSASALSRELSRNTGKRGYRPRQANIKAVNGCDLNLKQPQQKERQRDLFFAKTVSIFEPLKLMPVNLKCQPHRVVSSAYRQDKIAVL